MREYDTGDPTDSDAYRGNQSRDRATEPQPDSVSCPHHCRTTTPTTGDHQLPVAHLHRLDDVLGG